MTNGLFIDRNEKAETAPLAISASFLGLDIYPAQRLNSDLFGKILMGQYRQVI